MLNRRPKLVPYAATPFGILSHPSSTARARASSSSCRSKLFIGGANFLPTCFEFDIHYCANIVFGWISVSSNSLQPRKPSANTCTALSCFDLQVFLTIQMRLLSRMLSLSMAILFKVHLKPSVPFRCYQVSESVCVNRQRPLPDWLMCCAVKVICHPVTGKSKGYGFVKFASEDEAAAALHKMGGEVGLLSCGARQAQVRMFCYNMHYFANAIVPFDEIASGDWWKEHKGTLCKQRMIWCHFFLEE